MSTLSGPADSSPEDNSGAAATTAEMLRLARRLHESPDQEREVSFAPGRSGSRLGRVARRMDRLGYLTLEIFPHKVVVRGLTDEGRQWLDSVSSDTDGPSS